MDKEWKKDVVDVRRIGDRIIVIIIAVVIVPVISFASFDFQL